MAQAVSRLPLNSEAYVRAWVSPRGIVMGKVGLGQVFLRVFRFCLVNIIPSLLSIPTDHPGYEQWVQWWPQFRGTVSPMT
jgi:hypothetical protein